MKSRQADFVSAYTQAPLDTDIYMCIPASFVVANGTLVFTTNPTAGNSITYVLCLCKNLYGLRQAGCNWFETLRSSLLSYGFNQSIVDPCLFLRHDIVLVLYVDDCLFFAKEDAILDNFLQQLGTDFVITSEADVGAFLGIDVRRTAEGHLQLTQPGLISSKEIEKDLQRRPVAPFARSTRPYLQDC
jgi:histone deacetylase 1/2